MSASVFDTSCAVPCATQNQGTEGSVSIRSSVLFGGALLRQLPAFAVSWMSTVFESSSLQDAASTDLSSNLDAARKVPLGRLLTDCCLLPSSPAACCLPLVHLLPLLPLPACCLPAACFSSAGSLFLLSLLADHLLYSCYACCPWMSTVSESK